ADRLKVVEYGFANIRVGRVAVIITPVEALWETGLGKNLLRLFRIVDRGRRLPEKLVIVGDNRIAGDQRITQGQRLVEPAPVEGKVGARSPSLIVPGRLCAPLVGEINVEPPLHARRL